MIFDLIHGSKTDQANAKAQIEIYKKENAELIAHNSLLQAREKTLTESILMSEKAQRLKNRQFYADMHDSEDRQRREEKERLLEAMWRGENVSNAALAGAGVDISKRVFQLLPKAPLVPEAREVEVAKSKLQELKTGATGVGTGGALVSAPATHWADSPFDSEYEQEDEYLEGSPSLPSHPLKEPSAATEGLRYYDLTVQGIRKDKAYTKKDGQVAWAGGWAPEMWWGKAVGEVYQGLFLGIGTA
ncbi:hypothetical protein M427DRAFT_437173 [Gonapodya prolifera JEL478]|uniref:MAT1 centre domain-containing protein n=1 Tax=Gonapodya prolifera (strain JEL478) TaxID=1344416 RepID=A0A139A3N2_GONPJ|nr:hypothetical protein M427DRAFT_437173 [Gonapodya prolifera JEL478]|eukprot:KXS11427.1 hypothetical protein M427DRAFT_437173 [Gonapodya prolifera JEL478]